MTADSGMPTHDDAADPKVEAMIDRWLEYINLWAKAQGEDQEMDRTYIIDYVTHTIRHDPYFPIHEDDKEEVVLAELRVNDELNYFQLMGVFENNSLVYATACVDTSWSEFFRGEFPTGLIDTTVPYERHSEWLNAPEGHHSDQWMRGYEAGKRAAKGQE